MSLRFVYLVSSLILSRILKKLSINCLEQLRASYARYRTSHGVHDSWKNSETNNYPSHSWAACNPSRVLAQYSPSRLISLALSSVLVRCQETRLWRLRFFSEYHSFWAAHSDESDNDGTNGKAEWAVKDLQPWESCGEKFREAWGAPQSRCRVDHNDHVKHGPYILRLLFFEDQVSHRKTEYTQYFLAPPQSYMFRFLLGKQLFRSSPDASWSPSLTSWLHRSRNGGPKLNLQAESSALDISVPLGRPEWMVTHHWINDWSFLPVSLSFSFFFKEKIPRSQHFDLPIPFLLPLSFRYGSHSSVVIFAQLTK